MVDTDSAPFIPPELVDKILSHLADDREGTQQELHSACAMVSRSWSVLVRRHRYRTFRYRLDAPKHFHLYVRHNCEERFNSLDKLVRSLDTFPDVCGYICNFHLSLSTESRDCLPQPDGQDRYAEPDESPSGWPTLTIASFIELLRRLTALRALSLPAHIIYYMHQQPTSTLVVPHLDLLEIGREEPGDGQSVAYVPPTPFCQFMTLFDTVKSFSLYHFCVVNTPAFSSQSLTSPPDLNLSVGSLTLLDAAASSLWLFTLMAQAPRASAMTSLDLSYIYPSDMSSLCGLIDICGPNLTYFAIQVLHNGFRRLTADRDHYHQLDLTKCKRLRAVSLKMLCYTADIETPLDCGVFPEAVDITAYIIANCLPSGLPCLDLKFHQAYHGSQWEDVEWVTLDLLEERMLLPGLHSGRVRAVSFTPMERRPCYDDTEWPTVVSKFPRLVGKNLLLRHNVVEKLNRFSSLAP